jgi:hypothetical protein
MFCFLRTSEESEEHYGFKTIFALTFANAPLVVKRTLFEATTATYNIHTWRPNLKHCAIAHHDSSLSLHEETISRMLFITFGLSTS